MSNLFVVLTLSCGVLHCCSGIEKIPLYFSYISSINPIRGFSAAGGIPALELALEMINNRSDILTNYSLQYTDILDSKCERTHALDAFFDHFTKDLNHTYIATACCGCSVATIPVAEISHHWNIPQLSYSSALVLNDRSRFRSIFRTLSTNKNLGLGIVRIMRHFGWRKMLVIAQNEDLFTDLNSLLKVLFTAHNWLIDISIVINTNVNDVPLDSIFKKIETEHYKIIMVNSYSPFANNIFCGAFQRNLFAPEYIWLTHLWYNQEWWKYFQTNTSLCSIEDMQTALRGSIGVVPEGYVLRDQNSGPSFSGLTGEQFMGEYIKRFSQFRNNSNQSVLPVSVPNVGFDLAWVLALGLDIAIERVAQYNDSGCEDVPGEIVPLEEFNYSNEKMGCILKESMGSVEFEGLSGPIQFNENGSQSENLLLMQQYQFISDGFLERVTVAKIDVVTDLVTFTNSSALWQDIPYDGFPEETIDQYHIVLLTIYNIMVISGLIFSVACLAFNIIFRKKRVLKLSSPNLNYLIILGSDILYVSVFTFTYMPSNVGDFTSATVICNMRIWLFSIGYTVCFAVILAKTWRVYYIFNHPSPTKKIIKDWMLLIIVAVIVFGELFILLIGTSISNSRLEADEIESIENPVEIEDNVVKQNYIYVCLKGNSGPIVWLAFSYAYKGILQIIGMFMAFHIRKVKIKALNDSKQTVAIIYINTIILITLITSVFALDDYHNGHAAIVGLALMIDASLFLGALFVPKMIALYNDPNEKKALDKTMIETTFSHNKASIQIKANCEKDII